MSKYCKKCGALNENPLLKFCMKHIGLQNPLKKTRLKQVSKKKIKRLEETGGEKTTFEKVNEIDKSCWITGKYIKEPATFTFPHLLEKSKFPAFRLIPNNIGRCYGIEEHNEIDKKMLVIKRDLEKLNKFKKLLLDGTRAEVKDFILL